MRTLIAVYKRRLLRTSKYVMCEPWIGTIRGLPGANRGSTLCATQTKQTKGKDNRSELEIAIGRERRC